MYVCKKVDRPTACACAVNSANRVIAGWHSAARATTSQFTGYACSSFWRTPREHALSYFALQYSQPLDFDNGNASRSSFSQFCWPRPANRKQEQRIECGSLSTSGQRGLAAARLFLLTARDTRSGIIVRVVGLVSRTRKHRTKLGTRTGTRTSSNTNYSS